MHRGLLARDELHRPQVHALSQARHQGNVSQRPKRHHLTAVKNAKRRNASRPEVNTGD